MTTYRYCDLNLYFRRHGEPWDMHVYDGETGAARRRGGAGAANLLALCEAAFKQVPDEDDGTLLDFAGAAERTGSDGRRDENGGHDKPRPARPRPQNRQVALCKDALLNQVLISAQERGRDSESNSSRRPFASSRAKPLSGAATLRQCTDPASAAALLGPGGARGAAVGARGSEEGHAGLDTVPRARRLDSAHARVCRHTRGRLLRDGGPGAGA